jgi:glycosyltransferase involved in cell wall biosynthesis
MKIALVSPRYGDTVMGGAETGVRLLAEHLVALRGDSVEVFTTTAVDATTWRSELPAGTVIEGGVTVHRFAVTGERTRDFDSLTHQLLTTPEPTRDAQLAWIDAQGPIAPGLHDALATCDADVVMVTPYLYHPSVYALLNGAPLEGVGPDGGPAHVTRPVVFLPAAHDEPVFHIALFEEVFGAADGFGWYTAAEREVAERVRRAIIAKPSDVIGLGIDPPPDRDASSPSALPSQLAGRDYIVCLGRVDRGKGSDLLAELFIATAAGRSQPLTLVFVGPIVHEPPTHESILTIGAVDHDTKWAILRNAVALVSPSAYESFSLVVLEAWAAGVPVMVNGRCAATVEHCRASAAGVWFDDLASFDVALETLTGDAALRHLLAERGAHYVASRFSWPAVIERCGVLLDRVVAISRRDQIPGPLSKESAP